MKTFISLAIVTVFALITLWLQDAFKDSPLITPVKQKNFPDYFMDDFSVQQMDKDGVPAYVLRAAKLQHFSGSDNSEITAPHIEIHDLRGNWSVVADRATVFGDSDIIHLHDKVRIHRESTPNQTALVIETDFLQIDARKKIAETDRPARITTSTMELSTLGMAFDGNRDILKLNSTVRGTYAPVK